MLFSKCISCNWKKYLECFTFKHMELKLLGSNSSLKRVCFLVGLDFKITYNWVEECFGPQGRVFVDRIITCLLFTFLFTWIECVWHCIRFFPLVFFSETRILDVFEKVRCDMEFIDVNLYRCCMIMHEGTIPSADEKILIFRIWS